MLTGTAIGFGLRLLWNETIADRGGERTGSTTCATQEEAFQRANEYGDFVEITDELMNHSPYHGLGPDAPLVKPYLQGRIKGAVASIAYQAPYKQENDALKQSLGYEGEGLLVPLSGSVVRDNPGLLEVYQTNDVFTSEDGAITVLRGARESNESGQIPEANVTVSVGDEMAVFEIPADSPDQETFVGVVVRWRSIVSTFAFQGGANLTAEQVMKYVERGFSRVMTACTGSMESGGQP